MSQPKPPVPLPRRLYCAVKSVDDEQLKCSSPQSPTDSLEKKLKTPPPLPPKTWVKQGSRKNQSENEYVEILKVEEPSVKAQPTQHVTCVSDSQDALSQLATSFSNSYKRMTPWTNVCRDLELRGSSEALIINVKAEILHTATNLYVRMVMNRGGALKDLITELQCIADNLNKVSKGTKIAGITGGASTVAGGVAAAAGVILSPITAGASLALTAVGVGVAAAGGVTGASAAIANKANLTQDRKKIDKVLQEYVGLYEDILNCLKFINEGMELLKQHGLSVLNETGRNSQKVANIVKLATDDTSATSLEMSSKASGVIKGFALGMDFFFTDGKDGQKLKKGLESKLATKLHKLTEDLDKGLTELMKIKDVFSQFKNE